MRRPAAKNGRYAGSVPAEVYASEEVFYGSVHTVNDPPSAGPSKDTRRSKPALRAQQLCDFACGASKRAVLGARPEEAGEARKAPKKLAPVRVLNQLGL